MNSLLSSTIVERGSGSEKRFSTSGWTKRSIPLKSSSFFNKAKHSDEWHQAIDSCAGVLHPSDPKFPYSPLRQATDVYLKKKGKLSQADTDIRLAILIESHDDAKDIAIAACAHAMSAMSVRALLSAELDVHQANYWGLETFFQSLIAANYCNPASVTDREAQWARGLLPYAMHGSGAAAKLLEGIGRMLRATPTPNMNVVPEFAALTRRALGDFATQLDGFRLKSNWLAAHATVAWMADLVRTSPPVTPPGHLLPEHLLDAQFPIWRRWATWRPNVQRIMFLNIIEDNKRGVLPDLLALEGPDFVTGTKGTLKEGLIAKYAAEKPIVRFKSLVIEVSSSTREELADMLERVARALEFAIQAGEGAFRLFVHLTIANPINKDSLVVLEAVSNIRDAIQLQIPQAVFDIHSSQKDIGGSQIPALQRLLVAFDRPGAENLADVMLRPWLIEGIEKCIQECQAAIRTHMEEGLPWTHLAFEFYGFLHALKESTKCLPMLSYINRRQVEVLPSTEQLSTLFTIYNSIKSPRPSKVPPKETRNDENDETATKDATKRVPAPAYLLGVSAKDQHPLKDAIEDFTRNCLMEREVMPYSSLRTVEIIFRVWDQTEAEDEEIKTVLRSLAILVSKITGKEFVLRHRCLSQLIPGQIPIDFLKELNSILLLVESEPEQVMIDFTKLLVDSKDADPTQCWRDILEEWIRAESKPGMFESSHKLLDYSVQNMKVVEWSRFISDIDTLFKDIITTPTSSVPPIFQQSFHRWVTQLSLFDFIPTLSRLEEALGTNSEAVQIFLKRDAGVWDKNLTRILASLRRAEEMQEEDGRLLGLMQRVVGKLSSKITNDWGIADCVHEMLELTPTGLEACQRIWDAKHDLLEIPGLVSTSVVQDPPVSSRLSVFSKSSSINARPASQVITPVKPIPQRRCIPAAVADVMVAGWIQDTDVAQCDRNAIKALANVLDLEIYTHNIPKDKFKEVETFYETIEAEILAEAERLEGIKKALKEKDPAGTTILLEQLGIPDLNPLDEEIQSLPTGIIDAVEKCGDTEVEISFPLKQYTELQRSALGLPKEATTLLIRLFVDYAAKVPPSFCIHLDSDPQLNVVTQEHTPWAWLQDSKAPERAYCKSVQTAFTWQMNRILYKHLKDNSLSIAGVYNYIKGRMAGLAQRCIVCDSSHSAANAQLRRSTTCNSNSCSRIWNNLPFEVRVPEIRSDTFAIDVILTSVYAAAMSARTELLPGCPISATANVTAILNALPSLKVLSHAVDLSSVLKSYHKDAERLLLWACTHFRGHLTTASGKFSIPSLPTGTHQFLLANANPKLESDFSSSLPRTTPQSMVLFHGTSLDRLPAILAQGLKIYSGTGLQRTGAAHGKGIYMATDPATSFSYSPAQVSWKNSGLNNMRLLLGCEVAGAGRSVSPGIHVITDEKTVMVRYIFMMTYSAYTPNVNHITPAMLSGMVALRSGSA